MHLRQPEFTYSASGGFTKHSQGIQKFIETGNLMHIYKNELDKACSAHDADSSDIAKTTISGKILKERADEIAINPKYDGYQRGLESLVHMFFSQENRTGSKSKCK